MSSGSVSESNRLLPELLLSPPDLIKAGTEELISVMKPSKGDAGTVHSALSVATPLAGGPFEARPQVRPRRYQLADGRKGGGRLARPCGEAQIKTESNCVTHRLDRK